MNRTIVALDCGLIDGSQAADALADHLLQIAGALQVELYLGLGLRTRVGVALHAAECGDRPGALKILAELGLDGLTDPDQEVDPLIRGSLLVGHASPRTHRRLGQVVLDDRWQLLCTRLPDHIVIRGVPDGRGPEEAASTAALGDVSGVQVWTEDPPLDPGMKMPGETRHELALIAARLSPKALTPAVIRPLCVHRTPLWWGLPGQDPTLCVSGSASVRPTSAHPAHPDPSPARQWSGGSQRESAR